MASRARGPATTYFENDVWSKTATASRVARCSAADQGSHDGLPQEYASSAPGAGAKTLGRSQPILEPKIAPAASARKCTGDRRTSRAVTGSRFGHGRA